MVDRKAGLVYVVDDVPSDGDTVTWDASLRQWVPRAGGSGGLSADYATALGKVDLTGFIPDPGGTNVPIPTLFDPTSSAWSDHGWTALGYPCRADGMYFFVGEGDPGALGEDNTLYLFKSHNASERDAQIQGRAYADNTAKYVEFHVESEINPDGTAPLGALFLREFVGGSKLEVLADGSGLGKGLTATFTAATSQTDPIIDLKNNNGSSWLQYVPAADDDWILRFHDDATKLVAFMEHEADSFHYGGYSVTSYADAGSGNYPAASFALVAQNNPDGTGAAASLSSIASNTSSVQGSFSWFADGDAGSAGLTLVAFPSQTAALLDLQASDASHIVQATGDKKIGFYNKAPVALQTGVAVSSAGIHAALVNLGLITA